MVDNKTSTLFSLKDTCKERFKTFVKELKAEFKGINSFLMIVDKKSIKILSSFMKQMDLLEFNIMAIELLENSRKVYQN